MKPTILAGLLALPVVGTLASAQSTIYFSDDSGLSAEAQFTLLDGGTTLEVRLRNTSTGVPAGFSNSDQILTGVSWDFGAMGVSVSDPMILGGSAKTGPTSMSINFDVMNVGSDADVSGEYGYGNGGTTNTLPNFVSTNAAGLTPFGGPNLDGPANVSGPQGGMVPTVPVIDIGGLGAIQDEIVASLQLDQPLADLSFLDSFGAVVEYGSDAAFLHGYPGCDDDASVTKVNDAGGLNAQNALCAAPGSLPTLGNMAFTLEMDDPLDVCGITPGSATVVFLSAAPASFLVPGLGCSPGSPGEVMIDLLQAGMISGPVAWAGPGSPASHVFHIPATTAICGLTCYGQGAWLDPTGASHPAILTNRLDATVGH